MEELKMDNPSPELVKGLAMFREQLTQPEKSREVKTNKYSYRYATLNDVISAIDKAIKGTGLSYLQVQEVDSHTVTVRTVIVCAGDRLDTGIVQMAAGGNPQAVGSAITYARRYSLSTAFGIAPDEDDDGQAAESSYNQSRQQGGNQNSQQRQYSQQPQQQPTAPTQLLPSRRPAGSEHIQAFKDKVEAFAQSQGTDDKSIFKILFSSAQVEAKPWKNVTTAELAALNLEFNKLQMGGKTSDQ